MRGSLLALLLAASAFNGLASASEPLTHAERRYEKAGSFLQYAIPAAGLAATYFAEPNLPPDPEASFWLMGRSPRHDLLMAVARSWAVTAALKYSVREERPNGSDRRSFPSGHTSLAATGAEFIRKEYGWGWAAPAYLAASFVAWSRVEADKHYTHDVLAGAAIGILANHDFWRRDTRVGQLRIGAGPVASAGFVVPGLQFELTH
jgi:membrane-associated phospholipid phosphatase